MLSWMGMLLLIFCVTGNGVLAESSYTKRKKTKLDPVVEKALAEYAEKGAPAKARLYKKQMVKVVEAIHELTPLSAAEITSVMSAAEQAVSDAVAMWKPRFVEERRVYLGERPPARLVTQILSWKSDENAVSQYVEDAPRPDQLPTWSAALKSCLGAERSAIWAEEAGKREKQREKEVLDYLTPKATKALVALDREIVLQIDALTRECHLPAAQTTALDEGRKKVLGQIKDREVARTGRILRAQTDEAWQKVYVMHAGNLRMDIPAKMEDAPEWPAEMRRILTGEQLAAWEKARADKEQTLAVEIAKGLKSVREAQRDAHLQILKGEAQSMKECGAASAEHLKLLEAGCVTVVDGFMEEWEKKMIQSLIRMTGQEREQTYAGHRGIMTSLRGESDPREMPAWLKKVDEILSSEEKKRWQAFLAERDTRAARLLGRLALMEMDKRVLLTAAQREKLEPLALELMKKYLLDQGIDDRRDFNFSAASLVKVLAGAKTESVQPLLDETQWKHWKDGLKDDGSEQRGFPSGMFVAKEPAKAATPVTIKAGGKRAEPPSVESVISEHLKETNETMAAQQVAVMQLRVEEAARIGALPPQAVARLNTAAKGSVEAIMIPWRIMIDQWVRSQLQDANSQNVRARLEGLGNVFFGNRGSGPEDGLIWKSTVQEVMPEDKGRAWQKEQDARQNYACTAIAGAVMRQVQKRCPITPEEEKRLEPLIHKAVSEYAVDIQNWCSRPWYLTSYYCVIPLAGVPEKDLAQALSPARLQELKGSALAQADNYWEGIKQMHQQRMQNGASQGGMIISY